MNTLELSSGVRPLDFDHLHIPVDVIQRIPAQLAYHYQMIPVAWKNNALHIAMPDPQNITKLDEIRLLTSLEIVPLLANAIEIQKALKHHYGIGADTIEKMAGETVRPVSEVTVADNHELDAANQDASIIKFVNQLLLDAYEQRATDIHIEPDPQDLRIRRRIDGILYEARIPAAIQIYREALSSRIKIMANLDIAERRLPQDGRFKVKIQGKDLDIRVSTLPTPHGESINLRLLTSRAFLDLEHLGFETNDIERLYELLKKPHGIIFLTGPTGSGKTTTLYAFLSKLNDAKRKIITIEDPIEYQMQGITQIQVQPKINLTFSQGLRSMLRHDPDVMMVGEVRDTETAEITIRVAMTGHLVFSTLHTNEAAGAITRLVDMGVEPYLVSSSTECCIAQRLVRIICEQCKEPEQPSPELLEKLGLPGDASVTFYRGRGCPACQTTGYKRRSVIYEILMVTNPIRELILQHAPSQIIQKKAVELGMKLMRQNGLDLVMKGRTTLDEVLRVTQKEE